MPVTKANLKDVFSHHAPEGNDLAIYQEIRSAAYDFALVILENCPASADQQAALRHIREAVMTANASVALRGKV